jgi:sulfoxide reductase heme-binding subunit YedZ
MSPSTHWFWIISRGAGITALVLASTSICYGLMMAGRMRSGGNADRRAYHEVLALSTMLAIALHGLVLLGDPFLHPNLADVTIPFASSYKTAWTTLGIIAGWTTITVGLSFYLRDRIGRRRQALIHRLTVIAWLAGLVHAFYEGTDAGQVWFIAIVAISCAPVAILLGLRLTGRPIPEMRLRRRPGPGGPPPPPRGDEAGVISSLQPAQP